MSVNAICITVVLCYVMKVEFDSIKIKDRLIVNAGFIEATPGDIVVIRGENGSGKTLLAKRIAYELRNIGKSVVYLDQDNEITLDKFNVLKSISLSDDININRKMYEFLEINGYEYLTRLNNKTLSGGERRITNFIRCFTYDAEFVVLDEPTNDLDYDKVGKMIEFIKSNKGDKTVVIVSHDDRMLKLSNVVYEIKDHCLNEIKREDVVCSSIENKRAILTYLNGSFIRKCMEYNPSKILVLLIIGIFLFVQINSRNMFFLMYRNDSISDIEGTVVYNHLTETSNNIIGNNYLPISVLRMCSSLNPQNVINSIKQFEKFLNDADLEINIEEINLETTDSYVFYPIEYYDTKNDLRITVIAYYEEKYGIGESEYVDTSEYFYAPYNIKQEWESEVLIDIEKYYECVEELESNENYITVAGYVEFIDISLSEFLDYEEIKALGTGYVSIASTEVKEALYTLKMYGEVFGELKRIGICSSILLVVEVSLQVLFMKNQRCNIYFYRNFGIGYETLSEAYRKKFNNRLPALAVCIIMCIAALYLLNKNGFYQSNLLYVSIPVIYCSFSYFVCNLITNGFIKKYYRWDAR